MKRPRGAKQVRIVAWLCKFLYTNLQSRKNSFHIYSCKSTWVVWSVHGLRVWSVLEALSRFESRLGLCNFLYTNLQSRKTVFIYIVAKAYGLYEASMGCQCTAGSAEAKPGACNYFYIHISSHNIPKCSYRHKNVYMLWSVHGTLGRFRFRIEHKLYMVHCWQVLYVGLHFVYVDKSLQ